MGRPAIEGVHPGLLAALRLHAWPGNLRQLHALLRTACALLPEDARDLDWSHLPEDMVDELRASKAPRATAPPPPSADTDAGETNLRRLSSQAIRQVVDATQGNLSEAARRLGISRNTLYRWLRKAAGDARG
jgi:transcriptional regulator of acetoin/glycerol metabolism